jgi:hypothetical protein
MYHFCSVSSIFHLFQANLLQKLGEWFLEGQISTSQFTNKHLTFKASQFAKKQTNGNIILALI